MFLRNCWYVAAWSAEVHGDALLSRKLLGEQILFYRKDSGAVAALRDRCSHRFAPLSLGRKVGDCVRCMYHGLVFDADGKCVEEPGRGRPSPGTDVRAYPVVERWKQVWIWMGEPALADPALIPACTYQDSKQWASIPSYIHYKADYRLILDNLLDFSHLTFVHENTLGGSASIAEVKPKVEKVDVGVRMTRWYLNEPGIAPYLRGFETFDGPVDRWHIYELTTRGNVFNMDSGSAPAGTGAPNGHRVAEAMQFHATQIVTPEDERNSHFFWTYAHNFNLEDATFTARLADRIAEGFEEDRTMIEAQQKVIDENDGDTMAYIFVDNGLTLGRRLLTEALAAEAASCKQDRSAQEVE
ncbi:MAG: LysR family transcriptional regulator [Rhizobium sp.]|nr:MAG: LysR family transcriptional regulator [Rhizobium sp.]